MTVIPLVSVVSPVYGCRDCLKTLCDIVASTFEASNMEWELILVDDRSKDDSWPLINEIARRNQHVRGIRLSRNHGQHIAIWAGMREARGQWVAIIDCDLQDDPRIIPMLLETAKVEEVHAVVVERGAWNDSFFRRIASRSFYRLIDILAGVRLKNVGNFGIYSRKMVDSLLLFEEQEVFLPMMVALTGLDQTTYRWQRSNRMFDDSSYNLSRLLHLAAAIVIRFSDRPLKLSVVAGLSISFISAVISFILVLRWLYAAYTVPGWTSTILSVWFLSGLILATLGVHGFYIGRIFGEVKKRPRIIIATKTSNDQIEEKK